MNRASVIALLELIEESFQQSNYDSHETVADEIWKIATQRQREAISIFYEQIGWQLQEDRRP